MRKLEEHFCTYEQGLKLKELGFDEPCLGFYAELRNPIEGVLIIEKCQNNNDGLLAPLRSQALDFFRDKWLEFHIGGYSKKGYWFGCYKNNEGYFSPNFKLYHEAENALIDKLIELEIEVQNESK